MKNLICYINVSLAALSTIAKCAPTPTPYSNTTASLEYITLEEHFDSNAMASYQDNVEGLLLAGLGETAVVTPNINGSRLDSMNANRICIQVCPSFPLSSNKKISIDTHPKQVVSNDPTPNVLDKPDVVRAANDELATSIAPFPTRFRGFCFLPMAIPQLAAYELEYCVSELGFVGALVDNHLLNNTSYDSPEYDALWATLQRLDVPIYLHPTYPPIQQVVQSGGLYASDNSYPNSIAAVLGTSGWGWHSDCGIQFLKLWLAGVFDRFPDLKLVLGHMGEMLPYMLARSTSQLGDAKDTGASLPDTYARNVWVTTSGFFSLDPFATLVRVTAWNRIMVCILCVDKGSGEKLTCGDFFQFSVDYPWSTNEDGIGFMEALKTSGMVTGEEWENIAFRNAERLLKIS